MLKVCFNKEFKMTKLIGVFVLFLVSSCASHDHVRPGADGIHHVVIRGEEKEVVERLAIDEANDFCKEYKKMAAFVSEDTKYSGSVDESTHKTIKKASRAATVGGSMMGVMGGKTESNAGKGILGLGAVGGAVLDKDAYTADMKFKCQ
jgi:hypothetical protein